MECKFQKHNKEINKLWTDFKKGEPDRIPVIFGTAIRFYILNPELNSERVSFKEYMLDPEIMFKTQLNFSYWLRHNLWQDAPIGLPDEWKVKVDFQNHFEAAWLGCEVHYCENQLPGCRPFLTDNNKGLIFKKGIPDPVHDGGWVERNYEYHDYFKEKAKNYMFRGRPVSTDIEMACEGETTCTTVGPFTLALSIRGENIMIDMYNDQKYYHELMDFVTTAIIERLRAQRIFKNIEIKEDSFRLADDLIELISNEDYKEFVLPYHKKLVKYFSKGGANYIHLCGNATHHFKTIKDELNVKTFDTGYPVNFAELRSELGTDVIIQGGPEASLFLDKDKNNLLDETKRIINSGITRGKKFILREGNNMPPCASMENLKLFYELAREYGKY